MARAKELTTQRLTDEDVKMEKQARADLTRLLAEKNLVYNEDYTDESLKRAGISNSDDRKKIMRKIITLKGPQ